MCLGSCCAVACRGGSKSREPTEDGGPKARHAGAVSSVALGAISCPPRVQAVFAGGRCAQGVPQSPGEQRSGQCVPCWAGPLQALLQLSAAGSVPSGAARESRVLCVISLSVEVPVVPNGCRFRVDCNAALYVPLAWVAAGVQASF